MDRHYRNLGLLIFVAGLVFFSNLGAAPLWDRDEPRNAGCAVEMMQRGDWVVPVFNDELRTHKPVLLYWLMMSAYTLFGVSEFAARFWSASLGLGTVLLTYDIGRRLFNPRVATWAGLILTTSFMFGLAVRAATPDSLLIFCCTLAIAIFVRAVFDETTTVNSLFPSRLSNVVGMYAVMGIGVLAKGPVGCVLPTAVLGMYLLIVTLPHKATPRTWSERSQRLLSPFRPDHFLRTCWLMRPLTAITTILAVALPWYVWVSLRTEGEWTTSFFLDHNLRRATQTLEGHSGPPILFYVGAILCGCFPWSVVAIPAGLHAYRVRRDAGQMKQRHAITLLLCWVGVFVVLFSMARTKLPSYVTPCYPALALLLGSFVASWQKGESVPMKWLNWGLATILAVGVTLSIGLPIAAHRFLPGSEWVGLVGVLLIAGAVYSWSSHRQRTHGRTTRSVLVTAICFSLFLLAVLPVAISRHQKNSDLIRYARQHAGPVIAFGHLEPSWIFYSGRPVREMQEEDEVRMRELLEANADTLVITSDRKLDLLQSVSEASFEIVLETEYFLRDRKLVLVRPRLDVAFHDEGIPRRK